MQIEKEVLGLGIVKYSNVFSENKELVRVFKNSEGINWHESAVSHHDHETDTYAGRTDKEYRNSYTATFENVPNNPAKLMAMKLQVGLVSAIQDYCKQFNTSYYWVESYNFLKYEQGNYFKAHADGGASLMRRISLVYYFNDDYEGGEVEFSNHNVSLVPKANELLVFPSYYTYLHEVKPITSGVKYSVATWLR